MIHGKAIPVLLAVLLALPLAYAQVSAPVDRTDATTTARLRNATSAVRGSARDPVASSDPRICLEFPTNLQVIVCAEKYRPDRRRAVDA